MLLQAGEMKRPILIIWLLICLLPLTVKAEEAVRAPVGEGLIPALSSTQKVRHISALPAGVERRQIWQTYGRHSSEISNEEMDAIFAKGMVVSYGGSFKDHHEGKIILWDETAKSEGRGHITNRVSIKE
jgi:hypothetical protein